MVSLSILLPFLLASVVQAAKAKKSANNPPRFLVSFKDWYNPKSNPKEWEAAFDKERAGILWKLTGYNQWTKVPNRDEGWVWSTLDEVDYSFAQEILLERGYEERQAVLKPYHIWFQPSDRSFPTA